MNSDLPLLHHDRIARAAEAMISNYRKDALAEANRRAQTLRSYQSFSRLRGYVRALTQLWAWREDYVVGSHSSAHRIV